MAANENAHLRTCWQAFGAAGAKVFRLNTGKAWAGRGERLGDGSVLVRYAQPVALGLSAPDGSPVAGAPDLFGWMPVTITPEMVGQTLAVVVGGEAKTGTGRVSKDQRTFHAALAADGGIVGVVREPSDVRELFARWRAGFGPASR